MKLETAQGKLLNFFALPTSDGHSIDLAEQRRHNNLVIAFLHGEACPHCQDYRAALSAEVERLRTQNAQFVMVLAQSHNVAHHHDPKLIQLFDPTQAAVTLQGLCVPSVLVTDRFGEIYAAWQGDVHHELPSVEELSAWLTFIETLCEECTLSMWDTSDANHF